MKKISFIIGVIILIVILANLHTILEQVKWYSLEDNKKVATETKVVTFPELFDLLHRQRELAAELEDTVTYSLIGDEIRKGADDASDYERFLMHNDSITKIKVRLPITTYQDDDKTLEFISGKGEVIGIFEDGRWKGFDGSWEDLMKKDHSNGHE
ncbi:hypothetical protein LCL96_01015 [Rossellomorea aquimaris]|uniref:hypothetical protein n=1 Tax=Rossellomorea aquimaris TaxID=189382 RepID=UPI001CD693BE|nr:hypothetical protein [Rossellomorea aquimaris]MCA1057495.1 hypothetical protein [Rossellomorea aquimaris]